jgi:hypothetical protein
MRWRAYSKILILVCLITELKFTFSHVNIAFIKKINAENRDRGRQIEELRGQFSLEFLTKIQAEHKKVLL